MHIHIKTIAVLIALGLGTAWAGDRENKELDRNIQQMREFSKQEKVRQDREVMRDKSHDYRLKIEPNTSVGADENGVNVRHTYK